MEFINEVVLGVCDEAPLYLYVIPKRETKIIRRESITGYRLKLVFRAGDWIVVMRGILREGGLKQWIGKARLIEALREMDSVLIFPYGLAPDIKSVREIELGWRAWKVKDIIETAALSKKLVNRSLSNMRRLVEWIKENPEP